LKKNYSLLLILLLTACLTKSEASLATPPAANANANTSTNANANAKANANAGVSAKNNRAGAIAVTILHQDSTTFGKSDLYISDNAARFVGRNGDVIISTSAPDWRIILFNKSKNQALVTSSVQAAKTSLGIFTAPLPFYRAQRTPIEDKTLHVKLLKITSKGDQFTTARDAVIFQERRKRTVLDSILETADVCTVTPPVGRFINWTYNFGNLSGLPISLTTHFSDGSSETPYRTLSIEHTTRPASFFAEPTGFKAVASRLDVLISDDATTTLEDLWGSPRDADKQKGVKQKNSQP
jgi:hypothetical protein